MSDIGKEHVFTGRLVMLGFGCIGQGALPLLLRHIEMQPAQVLVIAPNDTALQAARAQGAQTLAARLTPSNHRELLGPRLARGDFLLNLSVDVSSTALIELCRERGALYLDTCIEPWAGGYIDTGLPPASRTNHALREAALALRGRGGPTAVLTHGANPGLVSHFVKQALLDVARDTGVAAGAPRGREDWARLAMRLGVRSIHIAERDTQLGAARKQPGEFVNTWSVEAFVDEGCQPAELGWGSHERHLPHDGARHETGSHASIYLQRPGASTRVRSWTPLAGPIHGFLITHAESISIADHLTLGDPRRPVYRPTVHYAYHPCDDAVLSLHELAALDWRIQPRQRVMKDEIVSGIDELGVLLLGHARGAYWYGSQLSIEQARAACPSNSATSLQVTAAVMAGVVWAMKHPACDVVEPDDLPFDEMLRLTRPYLGDLVGAYSDWTPLRGRSWLFEEDLDAADPWQFKNVRVV
ncbi:MAG TPA: saccharopine dehydrogenase C-terminal domain-containing protein [Albitalea sp.]|nr:saccharopine dehydrogenase C-terminal domain-containing protein [Albitalea sp.]